MKVRNNIIKEVAEKYPMLKQDEFTEFNERDYRVYRTGGKEKCQLQQNKPRTHLHAILEHKDKDKILKSSIKNK